MVEPPKAPELRAKILNGVCKRDTRAAISKAHYAQAQASNLHINALSQCTRRRQTYLAHSDYKSMLLLRSGCPGMQAPFEATGMCDNEELSVH
jgi:hypothetical protein